MPEKQITITSLVPGKRYRMVVETTDGSNLVAPSIEFVVPPTPRLLSTYTPTYKVVKAFHDTQGTYDPPDIPGSEPKLIPGTGIPAVNNRVRITLFQNKNNTNDITIVSTGALPPKNTKFRVTGVSVGSAPYYYDWCDYKVTSTNTPNKTLKADAVGRDDYKGILSPGGWRVVKSTSKANRAKVTDGNGVLWSEKNGVGWGDKRESASMFMTWQTPEIPAQYTDRVPGKITAPIPITIPNGGVHYHVDLTVPSEIQSQLAWTDTTRDVPIFFYISGGTFFDFNDKSFGDSLNSIVNSANMSPLSLTTSNFNQIYTDVSGNRVMTKRNQKVNVYNNTTGTFSTSRSYRFSIIRYTRSPGGSVWTGYWLQTESTFDAAPQPNRIVYSQAGIVN